MQFIQIFMLRKKTSVIFINTDSKENKPVQVPTTLLRNWKRFLLGFAATIIVLIGIIAWMVFSRTDQYYKEKLAKADEKFKVVTKAVDVNRLKKSFLSIDSSLIEINQYLEQRGLGELKKVDVGGEEGFEIEDANLVADYYENYLENIKEKVKFTPMGVPSDGEQTSNFGYRHNPFSGMGTESHFGIDFRGNTGEPVKSTADGVVSFAGVKGGYGNCIVLEHSNGFETLYGHLSRILVREGQKIKTGEKIGHIGSTGRSTGPHLHYEIIRNGTKINPEHFLKL